MLDLNFTDIWFQGIYSFVLECEWKTQFLGKHNLFLRQLQSKYMSYSISISLELDSYFHNKSKQFVIF